MEANVNMNRFLMITCMTIFGMGTTVQAQSVLKLDPLLDTIIDENTEVELLSDDFEHGSGPSTEGPVWVRDTQSPDGGYLLFSDRRRVQITRWTPSEGLSQAYDLNKVLGDFDADASTSSGIALDPEGRVVFCSSAKHAVVRIEKDGSTTILAQMIDGKQLQRPNDLVIKSNGSIYFTDNSRDQTGQMPPTVYLIKDGQTIPIITGLVGPNGITLSPDESVLYVNDIRVRKVYRYEVLDDDTVANGQLFVDQGGFKEVGSNDGIKTDIHGNVYNTAPGGIWIISPTGRLLGTVRVPDRVTNLGFGGADGKTLFLTGHASLYRLRLKTEGLLRP